MQTQKKDNNMAELCQQHVYSDQSHLLVLYLVGKQ